MLKKKKRRHYGQDEKDTYAQNEAWSWQMLRMMPGVGKCSE
jgi:hypothetical protein